MHIRESEPPCISGDPLKNRIDEALSEADQKFKWTRGIYWSLKIAQMFCACLITIESTQTTISLIGFRININVAFLGALIVAIETLAQTGQFHRQWIMFKMCRERLLGEWNLFLNRAGIYRGLSKESRKRILSERIESIISDTNNAWSRLEINSSRFKKS